MVGGLVGCGSGVLSMGQLAIRSLVRLFGDMVGRCVSWIVCGQLEDWSVRCLVGWSVGCSDSQQAVWLVDWLVVLSSLAQGQLVGWSVAWVVDRLVGCLVCGFVGGLMTSLVCTSVGGLFGLSVSQGVGRSVGVLVASLVDCLVGLLDC